MFVFDICMIFDIAAKFMKISVLKRQQLYTDIWYIQNKYMWNRIVTGTLLLFRYPYLSNTM